MTPRAPLLLAGRVVRLVLAAATLWTVAAAATDAGAGQATPTADAGQPVSATDAGQPVSAADAGQPALPAAHPDVPARSACARCHTPDDWRPARFEHARTGFALEGAHQTVACARCHGNVDTAPAPPAQCAGCHEDRHGGVFSLDCQGCHTPATWRATLSPLAHQRTGFPLIGSHALLRCRDCHRGADRRQYRDAPVRCVDCHAADFAQASQGQLDHFRSRVGGRCQACHSPVDFTAGRLPAHEPCFPIARGPHARVRCADCHTQGGLVVSGTCQTGQFTCTGCHAHQCDDMAAEHARVEGFACGDARCYRCHGGG